MRNVVLAALLGGAFWALQLDLGQFGLSWPPLVALFRVCVGILATACLAGGGSAWVVVAGALSPLAIPLTVWAVPSCPSCPWVAVALVWSLPRCMLARSAGGAGALAVSGLVAASLAGWGWMHFHPIHAAAAALFAGSVLSLGTLFAATETPISAALLAAARRLPPAPAREALSRAAASHRDRGRDRLRDAFPGPWSRLVRLADARAALWGAGTVPHNEARALDEQIVTAVDVLCGPGEPSPLEASGSPAAVESLEPRVAGTQAAPEAPPTLDLAEEGGSAPVTVESVEALELIQKQS